MRFTRVICCTAAAIVLTIGVSGCLPPGLIGAPGSDSTSEPGAAADGKPASQMVDALPDALLTEQDLATVTAPGAAAWSTGEVIERGPARADDTGADPAQSACEGDFGPIGGEQAGTAGRVIDRDGGAVTVTQSLVVLNDDPVEVLERLEGILVDCGETPTTIEGEKVSMAFELREAAALGDASLAVRMTASWPDTRSFAFDVILVATNGVYLSLLVTAPYAVLEFDELEAIAEVAVVKVNQVI